MGLQANMLSPLPASLSVCRVLGGLGKWENMLKDDGAPLSVDRRRALAGAILSVALPIGAASDARPDAKLDDDGEFVMIDGWVLRRDDLTR